MKNFIRIDRLRMARIVNKFNALINDLEIILKEKTKKCLFFIYLLTLFRLKMLKLKKKISKLLLMHL